KRHPELRQPEYAVMKKKFPASSVETAATAAFLNANVGGSRPLFTRTRLPQEMIPPDFTFVPAGVLWKLVPRSDAPIDPSHWKFPVEPEAVVPRYRRARGQRLRYTPEGMALRPERYEERLVMALVRARQHRAEWC